MAAFLPACLYAAQDFDYVRNISALGLGLFFVPLAVVAYRDDSFLLLMLAGMAPALLTIVVAAGEKYVLRCEGDEGEGVAAGAAALRAWYTQIQEIVSHSEGKKSPVGSSTSIPAGRIAASSAASPRQS